ncbi:GNAT family N-acetyltransferase [Vibrio sp. TBV020]|uniref:GNAT family N-acetyltransferase n=1 Tax=Vibrio sp. TBV020 TaxID=3137398 RepID=UPI0038CD9963
MKVIVDSLDHSDVLALLREHLEDMNATSPPESVHALDVSSLKEPSVTFWSGWQGEELLGCVALKSLDAEHGELKSMRTASAARKSGVGSKMLSHVLGHAKQVGMKRVSLETGSMEYFAPARALYEKFGFEYCEPFADYQVDPNSQFMTITL